MRRSILPLAALAVACSSEGDDPSASDTGIVDSGTAPAADAATDSMIDVADPVDAVDAMDAVEAGPPHYVPTIYTLFSKSCAVPACHSGTTPPVGLSLVDAKAGYDKLLGPGEGLDRRWRDVLIPCVR